MHITSHFLAVSLHSHAFIDLFIDLQNFSREEKLGDSIEIQNPLSLHVTFYYLPAIILPIESAHLRTFLQTLNNQYSSLELTVTGVSFLQKDKVDQVCFLVPANTVDLNTINQQCRSLFPNEVKNNQYPAYIPHMTLFLIKDTILFSKYAEKINQIIENHLQKIKTINGFAGFNLYAVNSKYSPQIQLIVSSI